LKLKGKNALVVGAGRNAGRAITIAMAREDANVAAIARQNQEEIDETIRLAQEHGTTCVPYLCDATDRDAVIETVKQASKDIGPIDILTYGIGLRPGSPFVDIPPDMWRQVFAANVDGAFYFSQAVLPKMVERQSGSIVFTTGLSAHQGRGWNKVHVGTTKGALRALAHGLAAEFGPHGIRVNCMTPTYIDVTRENPEWYQDDKFWSDDGKDAEYRNRFPLRHKGSVKEVADAVIFLASDESSFITGQSLHVSGGIFMS
jgi:NAD(P)-dependent dehydrogenase (short-subunit alcohol dehydrogenase family)